MREFVNDFTAHPLIPGGLLGSVAGDPQFRKLHPLDGPTLLKLNKQNTLETVSHFQQFQMISSEQSDKLLAVDGQYVRYFKDLCLNIPEIAEVTGCDRDSVKQLARSLFSAKLMAEYLEILTPPQLSYERTAAGTVDLLERLFDCFRQIIGGGWSVFFPRQELNLVADASAQFWVASLYSSGAEEMMHSAIELCRIFGQMCRKNGLSLAPALKEKVIHHFHYLSEHRGQNFANARLVRNCFETVINAQASRLATRSEIDAASLSVLEAADLLSPAQDEWEAHRKSGKGYMVKCDYCQEVYTWTAGLEITDGECARCHKTYSCEFGIPVE